MYLIQTVNGYHLVEAKRLALKLSRGPLNSFKSFVSNKQVFEDSFTDYVKEFSRDQIAT